MSPRPQVDHHHDARTACAEAGQRPQRAEGHSRPEKGPGFAARGRAGGTQEQAARMLSQAAPAEPGARVRAGHDEGEPAAMHVGHARTRRRRHIDTRITRDAPRQRPARVVNVPPRRRHGGLHVGKNKRGCPAAVPRGRLRLGLVHVRRDHQSSGRHVDDIPQVRPGEQRRAPARPRGHRLRRREHQRHMHGQPGPRCRHVRTGLPAGQDTQSLPARPVACGDAAIRHKRRRHHGRPGSPRGSVSEHDAGSEHNPFNAFSAMTHAHVSRRRR